MYTHHHFIVLGLVSFTLAASASPARVDVVTASAPTNMDQHDLGRFFDANLRPMEATADVERRTFNPGETSRVLQTVRSEIEFKANASAWGIGGVSAGANYNSTHAYFRAIQIDQLYEATQANFDQHVPEGATYYVSAIYMGHMYEVTFSGEASSVSAAMDATAGVYEGGLSAWAASNKVEFKARTVGLTPKQNSTGAIFASSDAEIRQNYEVGGTSRAIMFRLSEVPGRNEATPENRWIVTVVEVRFPTTKPKNQAWDFMGLPDPWIKVTGPTTWDSYRNDTLKAQFNHELGTFTLGKQNPLQIQLFDRDTSAHDFAGRLTVTGPNRNEAAGGISWFKTEAGASVALRFQPVR